MSPYRLKYNESESNIKNYNFLYKNTKKAKTLSKQTNKKSENFKNPKFSIFGNFEKYPKLEKSCRKYFDIFGVFIKEIVTFNIGFGFVVLESIW